MIIIVILSLTGYSLFDYAEKTWDNPSTWSTEQRIKYPDKSSELKIEEVTGPLDENGVQPFSFAVEYCLLYEIEKSNANATIKCSLLPNYYSTLAASTLKDWEEHSDVYVVIKPSDVAPTNFLNRINKTYEFLTLGSERYQVSLSVTGRLLRPKETLMAKIQHVVDVWSKKNSEVEVVIDSYAVIPIEPVSDPAKKQEVADAWAKSVEALLKTDFVLPTGNKQTPRERVNNFRTYFNFSAIECAGLSDCTPSYEENPAEKVAYFMYGLSSIEPSRYAAFMSDFTEQLYPFKPVRPAVTTVASGREEDSDWSIFSVYSYPICPVAELITGKKQAPSTFFKYHANKVFTAKATVDELLTYLGKYDKKLYENGVGWDGEFMSKLDQACAYVLEHDDASTVALKKRVIDVYFDMLSFQLDAKVIGNKESLANLVYTFSLLTPYKSPYLLDGLLMKDRAAGIVTTKELADSYTEWKSVLNTLIVLYLYEAL